MPQLLTQDHGFASQEENKVQAVVQYVNGLTQRYFYLDELPSNAVRSYYADIYMGEVLNGDIDQFVHNSQWDSMIVENVSAALDIFGLTHQASLFSEVRDFIERDRPRLDAYLAGEYASPVTRSYMHDLAKIGGGFFERFIAHPDGREAGARQIAVAPGAHDRLANAPRAYQFRSCCGGFEERWLRQRAIALGWSPEQ